MSKSGAPSAASASASASSDPHSLPPNIKGLIQRYLAVSLPTITLSPELIAVLDKADIVIPTRVQVTMRWWNEDPANALSVHPKLNSPLSEPIARHQERLRQRRQDQLIQGVRSRQEQINNHKTKATSPVSSPPRSTVASLLMRPWSGKKLLTVLRPGKGKGKAQDGQGQGQGQAQGHGGMQKGPKFDKASTPNAASATKISHAQLQESDIKPLPSLPESAYPNTVAYPVRCSLDQLHRYFLEMSSLTLEIQIVDGLSAVATVPNMASLLHNIHGTFSGVFPTIILKNTLDLSSEQLFSQQAVIGVVVFQSWLQDTSDVGDSSEGSESTGSIMNEPPTGVHRYHEHQKPPRHHESGPQYPYRPPQSVHQNHRQYHPHHPHQYPRPQHDQRPRVSVDYSRRTQHIQDHSQRGLTSSPVPLAPQHPSQRVDAWGAPGGDNFRSRTSLRFGEAPHHSGHPQREFSNAQDHREKRLSYSKNDLSQPSRYSHTRQRSQNDPSTDGAWGRTTSEESGHRRHVRKSGHGKQPTVDSDGRPRPNVKIPVPDTDAPYTHVRPTSNRYSIPVSSIDESIPYEDRRRSHDTNMTNIYSQGSRSRPRSGATAAAIGRLDSVLARGEDLLLGMRTSFALDPEEVHRSRNSHLRSTESELLPMSKVLPYWPSKSRFYLELSIPAAYLTSHGLLKGSSKPSKVLKEKRREDSPPALSPVSPPQRHGQDMSGSQQFSYQRRPQREDVQGQYESQPPSSPPRQLRRSRGPIQFESISPRAARNHQREPSTSGAAYQSFLPGGPFNSGFVRDRDSTRGTSGPSVYKESPQDQPHPQPRKSKSYPPQSTPPSQRNSRRRRLSSHDRLQIRMNPKAGDILNYVPDLFPSRSMSALVIPEYKGTSSSSSATTTDAEDGTTHQKQGHQHHQRQGTSYSNPPFGSTAGTPYRPMRESNPLRKNHAKKHRQEFNFQTKCQFHLTPETMAACMIENISVEVWKLNSKRQTMIELGTAKLPLHKVLTQIMHKTAVYPTDVYSPGQRYHPGVPRYDSRYPGRGGLGGAPEFGPRAFGQGHPSAQRPAWRLEPNVYDIRSRHGTIIGQLDADIWVHPRSEYWKSNAKHFCRFCKIYITDNKSSRNIHDNGSKHKENVERFLREQNQRSRDKEINAAKMDKQMEAIERAAMEQYQRDVEAGLVAGSAPPPPKQSTLSSSLSTTSAPPQPQTTSSTVTMDLKAQIDPSDHSNTQKSTDPEPPVTPTPKPVDETVGQPGEWQTVEVRSTPSNRLSSRSNEPGQTKEGDRSSSHYVAGADDDDDGEHDPEDLRGFKVVEKTYPTEHQGDSDEGSKMDDGAPMFKKRKAGAGKPRNIRRKV
ncbi:WW domain binding protein 4 [Podila clonocystis]|nr:WW domain binding protein 4 [Podila clonocystis]